MSWGNQTLGGNESKGVKHLINNKGKDRIQQLQVQGICSLQNEESRLTMQVGDKYTTK